MNDQRQIGACVSTNTDNIDAVALTGRTQIVGEADLRHALDMRRFGPCDKRKKDERRAVEQAQEGHHVCHWLCC